MDNIDIIFAILQTYVAFIAFATIVATLRQSFGTPLTQFQYILFRFFVESGLLHVIMLLIPIMLFNVYGHEPNVWSWSTILIIVIPIFYLPYYLYRRSKVKDAVTPISTKVVIAGYVLFLIFNILLVFGKLPFGPSLFTISLYFMWSMVAVILIFLTFLSTFIHHESDGESENTGGVTIEKS